MTSAFTQSPETAAADVLRARAKALAQREPLAARAGSMLEVLEFALAHERYAVETRLLGDVVPLRDLAPLPGMPPFLRGIVNVRGRILPVLDVKRFFDLPDEGITDLHCIIVVEGSGMAFGLLADVVVGVRQISVDDLQPSLPTLSGIRAEYLQGVTPERLIVLDLVRILADPRLVVDAAVEG